MEPLSCLQVAKDCAQTLASGCSAWQWPGGMSMPLRGWPSRSTSVPAGIYRLDPSVLLLWLQSFLLPRNTDGAPD